MREAQWAFKGILGLIVLIALAGCGGEKKEVLPGAAAVYERIAKATDCGQLQQEFETAADNFDRGPKGTRQSKIELSYMEAAQERMKSLHCPQAQ